MWEVLQLGWDSKTKRLDYYFKKNIISKNLNSAFIQAMTRGTFGRGIVVSTCNIHWGGRKTPTDSPTQLSARIFLSPQIFPTTQTQVAVKAKFTLQTKIQQGIDQALRLLVQNSFLKKKNQNKTKNKPKNKQQSKTD